MKSRPTELVTKPSRGAGLKPSPGSATVSLRVGAASQSPFQEWMRIFGVPSGALLSDTDSTDALVREIAAIRDGTRTPQHYRLAIALVG